MNNLNKTLSLFLDEENITSSEGNTEKVCDKDTGECYTIKTVDGIVERVDKKYITEDGRILLKD